MQNVCSIYVIKNHVNSKVYVGQTWETIEERFKKHKTGKNTCSKLANAFSKYGRDSFYAELITVCPNQELADYNEILFIQKFDSIKNGYNIKGGGSKGKHSQETKDKIAASNRIALKGNVISDQTKKKLSASLKGKSKPPRTLNHTSNIKISRRKQSKFTIEIIQMIRQDYSTGLFTHKQLAMKYNSNKRTITDIVNFKTWK